MADSVTAAQDAATSCRSAVTATWLAHLGYDVVIVDIGEFEKLEGCVTCLSVLVPGR
ncbi:MAG TPA: hypothetical protein VFR74_02760 [Jiangellales bacterium]|nr:hypothetical protein [Jiangellales bacterium]